MTGLMLVMDVFEANSNALIGELRAKLAKVQRVRASAKEGGDYEHTVTASVRVIQAAIDAAEKQTRIEIERQQKGPTQ